jgi:hypothetical protein
MVPVAMSFAIIVAIAAAIPIAVALRHPAASGFVRRLTAPS